MIRENIEHPLLRFVKFQKSYGSFPVLKTDDIVIGPGIYWIKGINGSGKTTLLKTVAGILFFEGDIILNTSISIKKQPVAYRRLVNFAEAEPIFPGFLTGMEMIQVFASAKNAPAGQEIYFIESMKMQSYIDQRIETYSTGMLKKLSLVLAFMGKSELILLDEPFITIDDESLEVIYKWIADKRREDGTSFFLSSHQDVKMNGQFSWKEILVEMRTLKFNFDVSPTD